MTLSRLKLGSAVTYMKYFAGVVSLIFLAKTVILNKIKFAASNLLILVELVVNEPICNRIPYNILQVVFNTLYPTIEGATVEMQLHCSFFVIPAIAPNIECNKIRLEIFHLIM